MRASFFSVEKEILPRLHHFLHSTFGMGSILNRCVEMNPSSACGEIAECHSPPIWNLSPRKFQISYVTSFLSGKPFSKYIQAKTASGPIPKNKIYKDTKIENFLKCGSYAEERSQEMDLGVETHYHHRLSGPSNGLGTWNASIITILRSISPC